MLIQVGQVTPQRLLALFERPELFDLPAQADERFAIHTRLLQFPQNPFIGSLRCLFFSSQRSRVLAMLASASSMACLAWARIVSRVELSCPSVASASARIAWFGSSSTAFCEERRGQWEARVEPDPATLETATVARAQF